MLNQNLKLKALRHRPKNRIKGCLCFFFRHKKTLAQSLAEYLLIVGVVVGAVVVMGPILRRSYQAMIKATADQIALQKEAEQNTQDITRGFVINSFTSDRSETSTTFKEDYLTDSKKYVYGDESEQKYNSLTNMGFTNTQE